MRTSDEEGTTWISNRVIIIGAGMTGMAAGIASGYPVFEAQSIPGGICSSYYVRPHTQERLSEKPDDGEVYTFEYGGGHWLFDGGSRVVEFLESLAPMTRYIRHSAVYFPEKNIRIPYPIQNNLRYLGEETAKRAFQDLISTQEASPTTLEEWLYQNFGSTLVELFFAPFHDLYTAGLYRTVAPQAPYKSPIDKDAIRTGLSENPEPTGYNVFFLYPNSSLGFLAKQMAQLCDIHYLDFGQFRIIVNLRLFS